MGIRNFAPDAEKLILWTLVGCYTGLAMTLIGVAVFDNPPLSWEVTLWCVAAASTACAGVLIWRIRRRNQELALESKLR